MAALSEVNIGARCEVCTVEATVETGTPDKAIRRTRGRGRPTWQRQRFLCDLDSEAWETFAGRYEWIFRVGTRIHRRNWQLVFDEFLKHRIREILAPGMLLDVKEPHWEDWLRGRVTDTITQGPFRGSIKVIATIDTKDVAGRTHHGPWVVFIPPTPSAVALKIVPADAKGTVRT